MAHDPGSRTTRMTISITDRLSSDTHSTYDVVFYGKVILTTVTHDPATVTQWIYEVERINGPRFIVGLDAEWRPSFNSYRQYPAATLQLCVGSRCLIYQLIHSPYIPSALINFIGNRSYKFVGVEVQGDLQKLQGDYNFGSNGNAVDLRPLAVEVYGDEFQRIGLKALARAVLHKEMEKPMSVTKSRWDNRWLTQSQIKYACLDAFVSFEIGRILGA